MDPKSYFLMMNGGVKIVAWGDSNTQEGIEEAIPVALFPEAVPEDLVKDFLASLALKDPEGKVGQAVAASVEEEINQGAQNGIEMIGLPEGEVLPEGVETVVPGDDGETFVV